MSQFYVRGFGPTTIAARQDARARSAELTADDQQWYEDEESYEVELHTTRKDKPVVCTLGLNRMATYGEPR